MTIGQKHTGRGPSWGRGRSARTGRLLPRRARNDGQRCGMGGTRRSVAGGSGGGGGGGGLMGTPSGVAGPGGAGSRRTQLARVRAGNDWDRWPCGGYSDGRAGEAVDARPTATASTAWVQPGTPVLAVGVGRLLRRVAAGFVEAVGDVAALLGRSEPKVSPEGLGAGPESAFPCSREGFKGFFGWPGFLAQFNRVDRRRFR